VGKIYLKIKVDGIVNEKKKVQENIQDNSSQFKNINNTGNVPYSTSGLGFNNLQQGGFGKLS
jgi:hypothetical protein